MFSIYSKKKVLITGHTGFKGSWLSLWLKKIGADVIGYALEPPTYPNHFSLLNLPIVSVLGDIRDFKKLRETFQRYQPEIVFHMAAQPLVRKSYKNPQETFESNIMGTVNVLEACRQAESVRAVVNITSDKCYENRQWVWGYRENDSMGGYDPYSASKGCAELVTSAYRNSFFHDDEYQNTHHILVASARSGNVIGGGDWAEDRLLPDIIRAASEKEKVLIRNPHATRPWQHVLEPLSGYLQLGKKLMEGEKKFAEGWNFGPTDEGTLTVKQVLEYVKKFWNNIDYDIQENTPKVHEEKWLKLDCSKAHINLGWKSVWGSHTTFERTVEWYRKFYKDRSIMSLSDIEKYTQDAQKIY